VTRPKPSRRWIRLVIPYLGLLFLVVGTIVVYEAQQPDQASTSYLSPASSGPTGASRLAQRLRDQDVQIETVTQSSVALVKAMAGNTTLLITTPTMVHPYYLRMLKLLPATTRVVLVAPDSSTLEAGLIPATVTGTRIASRAVNADCTQSQAAKYPSQAAVFRIRYQASNPIQSCYQGGLTVVEKGKAQVTLVGADDPFRNNRTGEHRNLELSAALLSATPKLIWLDLHRAEGRPRYADNPAPAGQAPAPPSLGPGSPDPEFQLPQEVTKQPSSRGKTSSPAKQVADDLSSSNPLWQAFPPWVFAVAALVGLSLLLLALARGRRLGGPVPEPLPIVVKATETVTGRGRLYQRAKARQTAAAIMRGNCARQLAKALDLGSQADPRQITMAAAVATGWPPGLVDQVLNGPPPEDDPSLIQLAAQTEALLRAVKGDTR
jgi:hypothetical protein